MFIREIKKKNRNYEKIFISHRLMESYRTKNGPRQRTVLNLGKLDLPQDQWKILADRIEQIVSGQALLFPIDETTEKLAQHYAQIIVHNGLLQVAAEDHLQITDFETVDLNSIKNTECRTIGVEHIGLSMCKTLGLDKLFKRLDFTPNQIQLAYLAIIGKIASPGSEKHTREWAQSISGLDELLGADFRHLPNNALYRISDLLLSHKDAIEKHLKMTEKTLFSLNEKIILYDLTNTYFEGRASSNSKAKRGRSKEKQKGCPLVTLGLIIDEFGFPKASKIFAGNVSEPKTLINMIEALYGEKIKESDTVKDKKGITILLDAGIATEDNLKLLKSQGYDYVCVARNKPVDPDIIDMDKLITIKADKSNKITVALVKKEGENILYCKSFAKANKEIAMKSLFEKRFEEGLSDICESISKKGGIKAYDKVLMRIGRLKGKYASIANYYRIEIVQKDGIVTKVTWNYEKKKKPKKNFRVHTFYERVVRILMRQSYGHYILP